jgi:hypothetical protein
MQHLNSHCAVTTLVAAGRLPTAPLRPTAAGKELDLEEALFERAYSP